MAEAPFSTARDAPADRLGDMLDQARQRTLGLFAAWQEARPDLRVPYASELNPPIWELGHVFWFQEWWCVRNRDTARGVAYDPDHPRAASVLPQADAWYDSSFVTHASRWHLPLPDAKATLAYGEDVLARTQVRLAEAAARGEDLYFWRLALMHEAMHNEAAVYMAQGQDIPLAAALAQGRPTHAAHAAQAGPQRRGLRVAAGRWQPLSAPPGTTQQVFCFDNELGGRPMALDSYEIDSNAVSWRDYLAFTEATGYPLPRDVRRHAGQWQARRFGAWTALDLAAPAVHLNCHDAQAWCAWAGRRLPTEFEWEHAALNQSAFCWGEVWEWTASSFEPFEGFVPHPYRDYSAPWFGGSRRVLRGASRATSAHIAHPRYRNYFTPERRDIHAGFRSCAV